MIKITTIPNKARNLQNDKCSFYIEKSRACKHIADSVFLDIIWEVSDKSIYQQ